MWNYYKKGSTIAKLVLSKPSFKVTSVKNGVRIKINKVADATKYEIKYKQGSKWKTKVVTGITCAINGLKTKKNVTIQIRAITVSGSKKAYSLIAKKIVKVK